MSASRPQEHSGTHSFGPTHPFTHFLLVPPPPLQHQVTAGVCAFNFPAMIPLWLFPLATAAGNCMLLKPSERDPGAALLLAELAREAGGWARPDDRVSCV